MFEKIPSLKDIVIYLMPGILICYFSLNIFNLTYGKTFTTAEISSDYVLSFVGIIFSFLIGFLSSQIQIITYKKAFKKRFRKMRTIGKTQEGNDEIKEVLLNRIIEVFEIASIDRNQLENDDKIIFTCLNYVKIKTNEESQLFVDRISNLSSFASTLLLPIVLGILNFMLKLNASFCAMILVLVVSTTIIFFISRKIIFNFSDEWYRTIFRQFLILSKSN